MSTTAMGSTRSTAIPIRWTTSATARMWRGHRCGGNNASGVVGVSPHVQLLPCKFMNKDGLGSIAGAIGCLDYVKTMKDRGVNIVATNNSWAFWQYSRALSDAIDEQRAAGHPVHRGGRQRRYR